MEISKESFVMEVESLKSLSQKENDRVRSRYAKMDFIECKDCGSRYSLINLSKKTNGAETGYICASCAKRVK